MIGKGSQEQGQEEVMEDCRFIELPRQVPVTGQANRPLPAFIRKDISFTVPRLFSRPVPWPFLPLSSFS